MRSGTEITNSALGDLAFMTNTLVVESTRAMFEKGLIPLEIILPKTEPREYNIRASYVLGWLTCVKTGGPL